MIADLTKMLQSAAKGKAPVVAIPIEGHAPVCLNRKRLAAWIKGVEVHSVEVVTPNIETVTYKHPGDVNDCQFSHRQFSHQHEGPIQRIVTTSPGTHRRLKITGRAGNVKTTCTLFAIARHAALVDIWNWAEKERAKNLKVISQGAIGTAAMKAARKIEIAKLKAAKLAEIEQGGCQELEDAKRHELNIIAEAREHGRGPKAEYPDYNWKRDEAQKAELAIRHVSHHAVPHRVRKTAAVIRWRLKALNTAWFEVTKYNPHRRKTTANKLLKVKKSIRVIQIVKDAVELKAKLISILPERIPNPRWPEEEYRHTFSIDPLHRPDHKEKQSYWRDHYNRAALAKRLREARQTIKALTPPPDNVLEMPEAEIEMAKAA